MLELGRTHGIGQLGNHRDVFHLAGVLVEAGDLALVFAGVDDLRIRRIRSNVAAFAAAHGIPVALADAANGTLAGNAHGSVVLLRAVDVIGKAIVGNDVVELRRWLVILLAPGGAAIHGDGDAAVVGGNHAFGVGGINPQAVIIAVGQVHLVEGVAA